LETKVVLELRLGENVGKVNITVLNWTLSGHKVLNTYSQ
jgi:hypothetical protein